MIYDSVAVAIAFNIHGIAKGNFEKEGSGTATGCIVFSAFCWCSRIACRDQVRMLASNDCVMPCVVIGLDFGVDWFKVSIVKKGIPLDIVLNAESKRKTSSAIAIVKGERIYGGSPKRPSQVAFHSR